MWKAKIKLHEIIYNIEESKIMAKFVIECPSCGKFVNASSGFFAKKKRIYKTSNIG